jgi:hypothetical protein
MLRLLMQTAERTMTRQDRPDLIERCAVLASVKTAARRCAVADGQS